jgi:hypothetical protein
MRNARGWQAQCRRSSLAWWGEEDLGRHQLRTAQKVGVEAVLEPTQSTQAARIGN